MSASVGKYCERRDVVSRWVSEQQRHRAKQDGNSGEGPRITTDELSGTVIHGGTVCHDRFAGLKPPEIHFELGHGRVSLTWIVGNRLAADRVELPAELARQ